jgi:hypothetical protein
VFCGSEEGRKRSYSCLVGSRSEKEKKKKKIVLREDRPI